MLSPSSTQAPESTAELLRAADGGDPLAWEQLIGRYDRLVRATVARYRLQEVDAEDAVQNTWLRVVERMGTIRDPQCLGSWLATTASRECLALIRRGRRETPDDAAAERLVATDVGPEATVVLSEVRRAVDALVGELTGHRRQLIHALFYQPDCSYGEVSRATGIPQGSIGPTRGRLLRELRCSLEERGFGPHQGAA